MLTYANARGRMLTYAVTYADACGRQEMDAPDADRNAGMQQHSNTNHLTTHLEEEERACESEREKERQGVYVATTQGGGGGGVGVGRGLLRGGGRCLVATNSLELGCVSCLDASALVGKSIGALLWSSQQSSFASAYMPYALLYLLYSMACFTCCIA
jgi:hypothetical protein